MSKQIIVQTTLLPGGTTQAFPQIDPDDIQKAGQFAIDGDSALSNDHLQAPGAVDCVKGGDIQVAGGMRVDVLKPLRVYRKVGANDSKMFEDTDSAPTQLTHATADPTNPRIDLIYAEKQENIFAGQQTRHFKEDPASAASLEGDAQVYTEKHNKLVVKIATGTAAASPAAPATPANGVPMYEVKVLAGATVISQNNIVDVRHTYDDLETVNARLGIVEGDVNNLKQNNHPHHARDVDVDAPASALGPTVQDVLNELVVRSDSGDLVDPLVRPEVLRPDLVPSDAGQGKLGSVGAVDGATPCVDFLVGRRVVFSGGLIKTIEPSMFPASVESVAINARQVNKHVNQATDTRTNSQALSLSVIDSIESDGGGNWTLQGYSLPLVRARYFTGQRLACARDGSKIELLGGSVGSYGDTAWYEVDTVAGTVTQRTMTGTVPTFYLRGAYPFGDGTHILIAEQAGADNGINGGTLNWYKLNCATGVCTQYTGTVPSPGGNTAAGTIGDLIAPNIIFLLVNASQSGGGVSAKDGKAWIFHVDTETFEMITPVGSNPFLNLNDLQDCDCCLWKSGQAVIVKGNPLGLFPGRSTWVFDYPTRSYTRLQIAQPASDINPLYGEQLYGLTASNVNGRVQVTSGPGSIYEIIPTSTNPQWTKVPNPVNFGSTTSGRSHSGFAALIQDGLPRGTAYILGGRVDNNAKSDIWKFNALGVIETNCGGVTGLTLADNATQARFKLPNFVVTLSTIARLVANPVGTFPPGSIKIEYSLNDGVSWFEVTRDVVNTVTGGSNVNRQVRITLIGTSGVKPCISRLNETFEQSGGPGFTELVVRFNIVTAGVRYLYLTREGVISIESTWQGTTADKLVLMRITPNGASAPTTLDLMNLRDIHIAKTGTKTTGSDPTFVYDLPVLPRYIKAFLKESTGNIKDLAAPTIPNMTVSGRLIPEDDLVVVVTGLATGESYIVELHV